MPLNPFVELARDPVGFLTALGYLSLLAGVLAVGVPNGILAVATVWQDWQQNKRREKWARLRGEGVGWIPTGAQKWALLEAAFWFMVASWALGAGAWYLG